MDPITQNHLLDYMFLLNLDFWHNRPDYINVYQRLHQRLTDCSKCSVKSPSKWSNPVTMRQILQPGLNPLTVLFPRKHVKDHIPMYRIWTPYYGSVTGPRRRTPVPFTRATNNTRTMSTKNKTKNRKCQQITKQNKTKKNPSGHVLKPTFLTQQHKTRKLILWAPNFPFFFCQWVTLTTNLIEPFVEQTFQRHKLFFYGFINIPFLVC